jgi:hypothetical protein
MYQVCTSTTYQNAQSNKHASPVSDPLTLLYYHIAQATRAWVLAMLKTIRYKHSPSTTLHSTRMPELSEAEILSNTSPWPSLFLSFSALANSPSWLDHAWKTSEATAHSQSGQCMSARRLPKLELTTVTMTVLVRLIVLEDDLWTPISPMKSASCPPTLCQPPIPVQP